MCERYPGSHFETPASRISPELPNHRCPISKRCSWIHFGPWVPRSPTKLPNHQSPLSKRCPGRHFEPQILEALISIVKTMLWETFRTPGTQIMQTNYVSRELRPSKFKLPVVPRAQRPFRAKSNIKLENKIRRAHLKRLQG